MDKMTFSDSKAAQNLVMSMLNTSDYASYKVPAIRILAKWFEYSSSVMHIPNETIRKGTLYLWRKHFIAWVDETNFPEVMKSHMRNVIVGQYRKCITKTRLVDGGIGREEENV